MTRVIPVATIYAILLTVMIAGTGGCAALYRDIEPPQVELISVATPGIGNDMKMRLTAQMSISNPNDIALPVEAGSLTLSLNDVAIGAVSFMADWLNMPDETTNLYVETMTITRYGQVLASVSGFAFVTVLVTFAFYGRIRFDIKRFLLTVIVAIVSLSAVWSLA